LIADYCFQLVMHYLKNRHSLPGIGKNFVYRLGITQYFENYFTEGEIYNHYQQQFSRITL